MTPLLLSLALAAAPAHSAHKPPPAPAPLTVPVEAADPAAAFLAANAKQPGVITLPSGLQYKVVKSGTGPQPKLGDMLKVNYEGKLTDGTVFDSSFERGKASFMPLARLVPAWLEAIPMMHVGDEWTLYVPPALGYGPEGRGPIPPNSVMIFRIQLLGMLSAD